MSTLKDPLGQRVNQWTLGSEFDQGLVQKEFQLGKVILNNQKIER